MKKPKVIIMTLCLSALFVSAITGRLEARQRIDWFKAGSQSGFWPIVERFIKAAAEDLNVDLRIHDHGGNPVRMLQMADKALKDEKNRPDCILFHNYKKRGKDILELSEKYKVPAFVFNAGFSEKDQVGKPREKYKYWIALMTPDDEYAGYILAEKLMEEAKEIGKLGKDGKIHMVAIEGNHTSEASNARTRGFRKALKNDKNFVNLQFFHSMWKEKKAYEAFNMSVIRYPEVSVFWTASDSMAIGVIKAAEKHGWISGKDFVTGGVDLLPDNQHYLESGKMAVSAGGHYAEGAWAVIAIVDYLNGYDFKRYHSTTFHTKMFAHTSSGFSKIGNLSKKLTGENIERIDFKRFSRTYTPNLKKYDFKFEALFE